MLTGFTLVMKPLKVSWDHSFPQPTVPPSMRRDSDLDSDEELGMGTLV